MWMDISIMRIDMLIVIFIIIIFSITFSMVTIEEKDRKEARKKL